MLDVIVVHQWKALLLVLYFAFSKYFVLTEERKGKEGFD